MKGIISMKHECIQVATLRGKKWDSFESIARVYSIDGLCPTITANGGGHHEVKIMDNRSREREIIVPEATVKGYAIARENDSIDFTYMNSKTRRGRVSKDVSHTVMTTCNQGTLTRHGVRRLTPRECWRLMGFEDSDFDKVRPIQSDTQLYKQAGNSIVVDVLYHVMSNLLVQERSDWLDSLLEEV